jgi:TP901-1 family phage major tail protein
MAKILGVDVLVSVGAAVVGSQSNASLKVDSKEIDVSDKTTGGFDTFLAGNRSWSIDCEAITLDSDAGQDAVEAAVLAGDVVSVSIAIGTKGIYSGSAMVNSYELTGEKDDKSTFKCTLKGATALTKA